MPSKVLTGLCIGVSALLSLPGAASAQVTYDFVGQPMTFTGQTLTITGPNYEGYYTNYSETYSILGGITLAQALNPNEANQQLVPLAYSFNDPGNGPQAPSGLLSYTPGQSYYGPSSPYLNPVGPNSIFSVQGIPLGGLPTLTFYTVDGSITAFDMTFAGSQTDSYNYESLTLTSSGDSFDGNSCAGAACLSGSGRWNASNQVGGTWTVAAPEIDPASVVSALTLLFGGLAVLRGRKRA